MELLFRISDNMLISTLARNLVFLQLVISLKLGLNLSVSAVFYYVKDIKIETKILDKKRSQWRRG